MNSISSNVYKAKESDLFNNSEIDVSLYCETMSSIENTGRIDSKKMDYVLTESEFDNDEIDGTNYYKSMPLTKNTEETESKKVDVESLAKFTNKLDLTNIFPPNHQARDIMVKDLNKEGLPRRSMNCFFVFRHIVYLEVLAQGLIEEVKDGVFFTQVVSEMWKVASEADRKKYKDLTTEIKNLQNDYHKDKIYCKSKPAGFVFVSMYDDNFRDSERKIKKTRKSKKSRTTQKNIVNQVNRPIIHNFDYYGMYPFGLLEQNINYQNSSNSLDNNFFTYPHNMNNLLDFSISNEIFNSQESFLQFDLCS
jgi:hypothetical protein